jgi:hypothetical protein
MPTLRIARVLFSVCLFLATATTVAAQPIRLAGTTCERPPVQHCPDERCPADVVRSGGSVVEPKTGRTYFLDYPCNLRRNEQVTFILSLHGGGSYGNWQRHYFPLLDYVDKHRLVVATPYSPRQVWGAQDDEYLQNIVSGIITELGARNIKAFWLAGHSQGGATSSRLVCTDFFSPKVDGFLSLSGGRIGGSPGRSNNFGNLAPRGGAASSASAARGATDGARGAPAAAGRGAPAGPPTCDFSHIYTTGEHEIGALPETSTWAHKYECDAKPRRSEVIDTKAGYVYDGTRQNPGSQGWGLLPRPGTAVVYNYRGCNDGRVVADVVRLDKGHTEGLEPKVTEELVKLMLSARGGKIQRSR